MTQSDVWRRYVEAGMALTQLTQAKAEDIVRDLVKAGELRAAEAQGWITEVVERSARDSELLRSLVRQEVALEIEARDLVSRADVEAMLAGRAVSPPAAPAPTPARARKAPATKAARPAQASAKAPAKRSAPAKQAAPTKAPAGRKAAPAKAPAGRKAAPAPEKQDIERLGSPS